MEHNAILGKSFYRDGSWDSVHNHGGLSCFLSCLVRYDQYQLIFSFSRTQILTQEYEGRECDISMVPWISHRSLFSAFLHCIYNPSKEEFLDWIGEAERETWTHIPAIKSHIAEEITLDRCVQRLRKRLTKEAWEKKRTGSYNAKMGERVPSFFTSPSLVNVGGLGVGDQAVVESFDDQYITNIQDKGSRETARMHGPVMRIPSGNVNSGWNGYGLKGNRSSGTNLAGSHPSGLFIDDEEHHQAPAQRTGESPGKVKSEGYVKTTSMARFYYRKGGCVSNPNIHKSLSDHHLQNGNPNYPSPPGSPNEHRKSKSHSDLMSAAADASSE